MHLGNLDGRLCLLQDGRALDVERASGDRFGSDPQAVYDDWDAFAEWAAGADLSAAEPYDARLGPPVPRPFYSGAALRRSSSNAIAARTSSTVSLGYSAII